MLAWLLFGLTLLMIMVAYTSGVFQNIYSSLEYSKVVEAKEKASMFEDELENYFVKNNIICNPNPLTSLPSDLVNLDNITTIKDPWGHYFKACLFTDSKGFEHVGLISPGPNGKYESICTSTGVICKGDDVCTSFRVYDSCLTAVGRSGVSTANSNISLTTIINNYSNITFVKTFIGYYNVIRPFLSTKPILEICLNSTGDFVYDIDDTPIDINGTYYYSTDGGNCLPGQPGFIVDLEPSSTTMNYFEAKLYCLKRGMRLLEPVEVGFLASFINNNPNLENYFDKTIWVGDNIYPVDVSVTRSRRWQISTSETNIVAFYADETLYSYFSQGEDPLDLDLISENYYARCAK